MALPICSTDEIIKSFLEFNLIVFTEKAKKEYVFFNPITNISFLLRFIKKEAFNESIHYSEYESVSYLIADISQASDIIVGLGASKDNLDYLLKALYKSDISETVNDRPFYINLAFRKVSC